MTSQTSLERASERLGVKCSFVVIPVSADGQSWATAGELRVPDPAEGETAELRRPAVLIMHGSAGLDSRGLSYARALNATGFVTLEIDLWAARGVRSPAERPKSVVETLPDAFAALRYLAGRAEVDPARIGIMGFSWGGVVSMLTATCAYADRFAEAGLRFAAHAPMYPVCWVYNKVPGYEFGELTGAPVFIQAGSEDRYDLPDSVFALRRASTDGKEIVSVALYEGATHAWDRHEPDLVADDPYSHLGKGGPVPFVFQPEAAARSLAATIGFFQNTLGVDLFVRIPSCPPGGFFTPGCGTCLP